MLETKKKKIFGKMPKVSRKPFKPKTPKIKMPKAKKPIVLNN